MEPGRASAPGRAAGCPQRPRRARSGGGGTPGRRARSCVAAEDSDLVGVSDYFAALASAEAGLELARGVVAKETPGAGNGLVAEQGAAAFDVLVAVPSRLCLCVEERGELGLRLPSEGAWRCVSGTPPDAGWELALARAVLDVAQLGDGGDFWRAYAPLLPPPEALAVACALPEELLDELQGDGVAEEARADARWAAKLCPDVPPQLLLWALAIVRSRSMVAGASTNAVVPVLDLCNTGPGEPNVDFRCDGIVWDHHPQVVKDRFELVALRDIAPGEELILSYTGAGKKSSKHMFTQYGFAFRDGGSPEDRLPLWNDLPLCARRVETAAAAALAVEPDARRAAVLGSLHAVPDAPDPHQAVSELLERCEAALAAFPTTLDEDAVLLRDADELAAATGDGRLAACVSFRLERKRLWAAASGLLREYASGLPG